MPKYTHIHKVLVIGSGPIVIGQAAEFDYAGTQACLALREEGIEVVLVNNNPATIMTDEQIADRVYLEPLTRESITEIIKKERPDGLLPTLGGQTGLNLAVALAEAGVLSTYSIELLGTPLDSIQNGEDRDLFKALMKSIDEPVPDSSSTSSVEEALRFASTIGYPVIIRPAYTLGGAGGGIADNERKLVAIVKNGLRASPIHQVLIEQSVKGWKEIEYEVMRDANDTCIIVCNMENIDPVGVHTGDSIVVAPSQTLNDRQYQMLRTTSCKVIRELGVVGGCNIQFALHPDSDEYVIIEVNPRVSRSSALASKATGYPIARIAAKLALGYHLDEVVNPITHDTYASFEPAIDYVAVKIPRWPFDKFADADRLLGTQMKATGEVMALARNFPAALQKAVRSLEIGVDRLEIASVTQLLDDEINRALAIATDERLFVVAEALRRGYSVDEVHKLSGVNRFFLHEIALIIEIEADLKQKNWHEVTESEWKRAKALGFTDNSLAEWLRVEVNVVHEHTRQRGITPSYKMVDTCAAEFSANTPYFYSSWNEVDEVKPLASAKKMVVLGSGPIRIGQGIEFDYCAVHAAKSLQAQGIETIVINSNPETVSTDFNTADHLYFEPLTEEDVLHIVEKESADGVLVQFGGQTAIHLAKGLSEAGVPLAGTSLEAIEKTEDREQFYELLQTLHIPHILGETVTDVQDAVAVAAKIGYPVLIRPSYVIGGRNMEIIADESQLLTYVARLGKQSHGSAIFPLLIDRFIPGFEVEVDAVCDGEDIVIPGIFQHIERAGIHSGDSITVFPSKDLSETHKQTITKIVQRISEALQVKGIMNVQFIMSEDRQQLDVLEVNLRASRTVPIVSKVSGVPMIDLATRVQMGEALSKQGWQLGLHKPLPYYAVKMPVFSSNKLPGVDPLLGPEMKSTGEAIGIGSTVEAAMAKAFGWKENGLREISEQDTLFLSVARNDLLRLDSILSLVANVNIVATQTTAKYLEQKGLFVSETVTSKQAEALCVEGKLQFILSTNEDESALRAKALASNVACFTSLETLLAYVQASDIKLEPPISMNEYLQTKGAVFR